MKAVVVTAPGKLSIAEVPRPKPGPYQALVKTEVAALCNATDGKLISGKFPGVQAFPLVLGHEDAGIVQEVGPKVRNFHVGDRVIGGLVFDFGDSNLHSGWGGFCEYTLANDHDAMVQDGVADAAHGWFECYEIQRAVDLDIGADAAVLLCMWREVYGAFTDFHLQPGHRVLIFGGGPVGLSFVKFGRRLGWSWIGLVDRHKTKRDRALMLGADVALAPEELPGQQSAWTRSLDAVIDAAGDDQLVNTALPLVKLGGSICIYGVLDAPTIAVAKSAGPFNFNLFVHQWPTRRFEREAQQPLSEWIRAGHLSPAEFVTHTYPIAEIAAAVDAVRRREVIKCLLRY
jgi:2-desacetyl-2-hydroxyethyl bacteriochlorophyllide A dehydrogenase